MSIRVLVVDDSVVFRRVVSDALAGLPDVEVIGSAVNGRMALSRLKALRPDLVTLDVEMPELNGIEVLEAMRAEKIDAGVVLLSGRTARGSELTVRALELGAFDFLTKPEGGTPQQNVESLRAELAPVLQVYARRLRRPAPVAVAVAPRPVPAVGDAVPMRKATGAPIVLVGVSTGGPAALAAMLPSLPANLNAPVLVVQHMPPMFTGPLAQSLARRCGFPVTEGVDGERAQNGHVYVAPGGSHMKVARGAQDEIIIRITTDPPENNCRPAVDYLFRSVALNFPGRAVAAILTGMGADGTAGLRQLKRGGCYSIAQDEASCVVFGMPKEAIQAGVVDVVVPLQRIAATITRAVGEK